MFKDLAVITTSRADYWLLKPLIEQLNGCTIIATTGHFETNRGHTIDNIISDFWLKRRIIQIPNKNDVFYLKNNSSDILLKLKTSLEALAKNVYINTKINKFICLGDRYELLPFLIYILMEKKYLIHISGGENTYNCYDNNIRDFATSMAKMHFATTEEYKNNIIKKINSNKNVFNTGHLVMDILKQREYLSKQEFFKKYNINTDKKIALLTFHPVTLEKFDYKEIITNIIDVLIKNNLYVLVTAPNSDHGSDDILLTIANMNNRYSESIRCIKVLGDYYEDAFKHCDILIGNSSSLMTTPLYFKKPVVLLGNRQEGRLITQNIIQTNINKKDINESIQTALNTTFDKIDNPFDKGNTTDIIMKHIKELYE